MMELYSIAVIQIGHVALHLLHSLMLVNENLLLDHIS